MISKTTNNKIDLYLEKMKLVEMYAHNYSNTIMNEEKLTEILNLFLCDLIGIEMEQKRKLHPEKYGYEEIKPSIK